MVRDTAAAESRSADTVDGLLKDAEKELPLLTALDTSSFTPMSPKKPNPRRCRDRGRTKWNTTNTNRCASAIHIMS